jgi:glutathione synthase/RimK-type ligase-like ATP-grasp enzyme
LKLAFLTYSGAPTLTDDDLLAAAALKRRGVDVVPVVWDAPGAGDTAVDGAIVRSCWDYHERAEAFVAVVDRLASRGLVVLNPPAMVRWNTDKRYLKDLAERGASIPRTAWIERGETASLSDLLVRHDFDRVVVKPRVSLSSVDTFVASRSTAKSEGDERLRAVAARKDLLIQELIPEIAEGEVSLLFFDGRFSHAVRKTPKPGDFRVQSDYGGTSAAMVARPEWVAEASAVLSKLTPLAYARVDVIVTPRGLRWMELEANDAELFFRLEPSAAERFADVVVRRMSERAPSSA